LNIKKILKPNFRFPDFIGIGAPKCATTFISSLLIQHPNIYMHPHIKELHYFDKNYQRGIKWYKNFFKNVPQNIKCGEFTPSYMRLHNFSDRVIKINPNIKLIACLRDPVKRSFSHYTYKNRSKHNVDSFEKFIETDSNHFLNIGLYGEQLENIYNIISKDNIHVIIFDELINNPNAVMQQLFDFLEVDQFLISINTGGKKPDKIANYKWTIKAQNIINVLGRRYYFFRILFFYILPISRFLRYLNKIYPKKIKNVTKDILSNDTRNYLVEFYSKDKKILENILGVNITNWS
jgi:hypothetical protein